MHCKRLCFNVRASTWHAEGHKLHFLASVDGLEKIGLEKIAFQNSGELLQPSPYTTWYLCEVLEHSIAVIAIHGSSSSMHVKDAKLWNPVVGNNELDGPVV